MDTVIDAATHILNINSVEPHYFAGYTGGRKSFIPGMAGYDTVEHNHKFALEPTAKALALTGNPVHEDMTDIALKMTKDKVVFSINVVLDASHSIYAVRCGNLIDSFTAATEPADEVYCVKIREPADIVITVASSPMDIDLYQAQKALDNGKLALKRDGILILVAECSKGVGSDEFVRIMRAASSPEDALERIAEKFKLGYHKAAKIAEIATWAKIWAVTRINPSILKQIFIEPFHEVQVALDEALAEKGKDATVHVLTDGGLTVPMNL
jgi:nickel-dependent lactate racemase